MESQWTVTGDLPTDSELSCLDGGGSVKWTNLYIVFMKGILDKSRHSLSKYGHEHNCFL